MVWLICECSLSITELDLLTREYGKVTLLACRGWEGRMQSGEPVTIYGNPDRFEKLLRSLLPEHRINEEEAERVVRHWHAHHFDHQQTIGDPAAEEGEERMRKWIGKHVL